MALALAAAGATLLVTSRSQDELVTLVEEIEQLGRPAKAITCDVTDERSCDGLVERAVSEMGQLDILVNNAGINVRKPVLELSYEDYARVLQTNLHGYFLAARAAGRVMVAQRSGKVINISSILGRVALAEQAATPVPRAQSSSSHA